MRGAFMPPFPSSHRCIPMDVTVVTLYRASMFTMASHTLPTSYRVTQPVSAWGKSHVRVARVRQEAAG